MTVLLEEMLDQQVDVALPLAEWGQDDAATAQALEQVLAVLLLATLFRARRFVAAMNARGRRPAPS